jgi:hypothetical protein
MGTNFIEDELLKRSSDGILTPMHSGDIFVVPRSATFIVAASDSMHPQQADFTCDGTDDQVGIQAAIDALSTAGGKILCMEGNYSIKNTITVGDNITVEFQPGNTVTIPSDHSLNVYTHEGSSVSTAITNADHVGGNDHVSIIGMNIDFNGDNGKIPTQTWAGIWLNNCNESIIRDCIAYDVVYNTNLSVARAFGILFTACSYSRIINCEGSHCGYEGIAVRGYNHDIMVSECSGFNNWAHLAQASAWLGTTDDPEKVTFDRCWGDNDIICHGTVGETALHNCKIQNCIVPYISIKGNITNCVVSGNQITSLVHVSEIDNSVLRNIEITDNLIFRSTHSSAIRIQCSGSTGVLENVIVSGNQIYNGCISIDSTGGTDIKGIIIDHNTIMTIIGYPGLLVKIDSTGDINDVAISNNIFDGYSGSHFFRTEIDGDGSLKHVVVSDNIIRSCHRMITVERTSGTGVAEYFNVTGNMCHPIASFFITDGAYTSKIRITDNYIMSGTYFTHGALDDVTIMSNYIGSTNKTNASITNLIQRNNAGLITENSGTATLVNGQTSIAVAHGLAVTPVAGDIVVTPIEAWGNMTQFYIGNYTATHFTVYANINPGQDVDFAWRAIVL